MGQSILMRSLRSRFWFWREALSCRGYASEKDRNRLHRGASLQSIMSLLYTSSVLSWFRFWMSLGPCQASNKINKLAFSNFSRRKEGETSCLEGGSSQSSWRTLNGSICLGADATRTNSSVRKHQELHLECSLVSWAWYGDREGVHGPTMY